MTERKLNEHESRLAKVRHASQRTQQTAAASGTAVNTASVSSIPPAGPDTRKIIVKPLGEH